MSDTKNQKLLASASDLLGREHLAQRLGVNPAVIESWISGECTVPGLKLRLLTIALAEFAARK